MTYRVEVERRAQKALAGLPKEDRARVVAAIDELAVNPRPVGCYPVRAAPKGTFRIRVGDYRVIYVVVQDERVIIVARMVRRTESTYRELT